MNKRIKELAEQARDYTDKVIDCGWLDGDEIFEEKFAALIVLECFRAAMIESKGHMNPIDLMQRMKEQVGIEE